MTHKSFITSSRFIDTLEDYIRRIANYRDPASSSAAGFFYVSFWRLAIGDWLGYPRHFDPPLA